jgi:hypothetical protein
MTNAEGGTWTELASPYNAGGTPAADGENYIQGSDCRSQSTGTKSGLVFSILFDYGSNLTFNTDDVVLMWQFYAVGANLQPYASGGLRMVIALDISNADVYAVGGADYGRNPYGGWQNVVADPTKAADYTIGAGNGTSYRYFGSMPNTIAAISKGTPHAVDAIRYGRAEIKAIDGDGTSGYATFLQMAEYNDLNTATAYTYSNDTDGYNRFGMFQFQFGTYLWKGLQSFGDATNSVDFRDANRTIVVDDTPAAYAAFNKIEINHASSNVEWTAISITALDSTGLSIGQFEMVDNATVTKIACTFTDMSTFIYQSNATCTDTIWRRCGQTTQGGATLTDSTFDESAASVALVSTTSTIGDVTGCTFNSDGTGHAVNLGTVSATTSMTWDNFTSGYAATNGSTGNETILVNVASGQILTINVTDRATSPTYYNTGTGTVSIVAGQKSFKFTVSPSITGYEWRIYSVTALGSLDGSVELDGEESATVDNQTYSYTYSSDTPIAVQIISQPDHDYEEEVQYFTLVNGDQDVTITLELDNNN